MIGINNKFGQKWTQLYENEVEKFTAHPPTYFDNDGEAPSFDEVFNKQVMVYGKECKYT